MSLVCLVRASVAAVVLLFKILQAESRELGLPKDRGVVNCKINSITITFLKHACFNENEQI